MEPNDVDPVTPGLGTVSWAKLQLAADRWGLGVMLAAEPARSGTFGQNIFLTTRQGQYVFRGNPLDPGQLTREQHFAEVLHQRCRVPAPWPYHYEASPDLFGLPYALMGRVPGEQLADQEVWSALSPSDRCQLSWQLEARFHTWSHIVTHQQSCRAIATST